jgi:hypothetical protein
MLHELLSRNFDLSRKDAVLQWYLDAAQRGRRFEWDTRPLEQEDDTDDSAMATGIAVASAATATGTGTGVRAHEKRAVSRWGAFDGVDNDAETVALMRAALRKVGSETLHGGGVHRFDAATSSLRTLGNRSGSKTTRTAVGANSGHITAAL